MDAMLTEIHDDIFSGSATIAGRYAIRYRDQNDSFTVARLAEGQTFDRALAEDRARHLPAAIRPSILVAGECHALVGCGANPSGGVLAIYGRPQ